VLGEPSHSVVIHGHFYQPPREDPWSGRVEGQASAVPYHDWNERIDAECYRAVVAARIPGPDGRIRQILNTLQHISFNFGPTLLNWMEREAPRTYRGILEADAESRRILGHGNAIAQAYHHTILPLATRRDKVTEVRWGMEDFRRRFRRDPAGMWLPETAVDDETLDVLAQEGIAFTIVAPHQVEAVPEQGMPGLYRTRGGRTIALFIYDGPLSHGVAFGSLLEDAETLAAQLARARPDPGAPHQWGPRTSGTPTVKDLGGSPLVPLRAHRSRRLASIATDGETYGHHHRFGEMALASALLRLNEHPGVRLENFASFLAHSPPEEEVSLVEPSSWSCSHGVDRWRRDCGCKMDPSRPSQQVWRTGLREAMEWLAERIHAVYSMEAQDLLGDPWEARNDYGRVVAGGESLEEFLRARLGPDAPAEDREQARRLLELERQALRLFTSCAWFFDDLAGIEPRQILKYADRSLELLKEEKHRAEVGFLVRLRKAPSNEDPSRDGATLFREERDIRTLIRTWAPRNQEEEASTRKDTVEGHLAVALEAAVRRLGELVGNGERDMDGHAIMEVLLDVKRLAYFHSQMALPIPFAAQTEFFHAFQKAPINLRPALSALRKPLGFTTESP